MVSEAVYNVVYNNDSIFLMINRHLVKIKYSDVVYVEARGACSIFYTEKMSYRVCRSLTDIADMLPKRQFERIHRLFIIHFDSIIEIDGGQVVIKKPQVKGSLSSLTVGKKYKEGFLSRLVVL